MKKQYQYDQTTYGFSVKLRKWLFSNGNHSIILSCPGGKETADKISHIINAGFIRNKGNGIDGLARANIRKLVEV